MGPGSSRGGLASVHATRRDGRFDAILDPASENPVAQLVQWWVAEGHRWPEDFVANDVMKAYEHAEERCHEVAVDEPEAEN